jgi:hypothetical protein
MSYESCNGCYSELTLAEYKAMMRKVEQEAMDRLAEVLQTTDDDDADDNAEEK